jgi:hypothetical protein
VVRASFFDDGRSKKYSQARKIFTGVIQFQTRRLHMLGIQSQQTSEAEKVMPHWVLKCPECKIHFTHSEVHLEDEHHGLWALPSKPEFHEGGSWLECPNCKKTSLFQRFQLTYAATA